MRNARKFPLIDQHVPLFDRVSDKLTVFGLTYVSTLPSRNSFHNVIDAETAILHP